MNLIKILSLVLALFSATGLFHLLSKTSNTPQVPLQVASMFEAWQISHSKVYASPEEKAYRLQVFHDNIKRVEEINRLDDFEAALNSLADLSHEEFKVKYLGGKVSPKSPSPSEITLLEKDVSAPDSYDWRTKGVVNAVKNQAQCGSCWAFSVIDTLETTYYLQTKTTVRTNKKAFSEQELVDCSHTMGSEGCNGGFMKGGLKWLETNEFVTEQEYPYKAKTQHCKYNQVSPKGVGTVSKMVIVKPKSVEQLEAAVLKTVVSVGVDAETWQFYNKGIVKKHCGKQVDHGVAVVGYGVEGQDEFWIVRNSWAADWGEEGYIRLLKNGKGAKGDGMCAVMQTPIYAETLTLK